MGPAHQSLWRAALTLTLGPKLNQLPAGLSGQRGETDVLQVEVEKESNSNFSLQRSLLKQPLYAD